MPQEAVLRAPEQSFAENEIPMGRPRVFILYKYLLFARGLEQLLKEEAEVEIVGVGMRGRRALAEIRVLQPDVIIVEVGKGMPEPCLLVARLLREQPQARVIRVSLEDNTATLYTSRRFVMAQPQDLVSILRSGSS